MLRSVLSRLAPAATIASFVGRYAGLPLFAICLVLSFLPSDARPASGAVVKAKVDAHGKGDAHGKAGANAADPDAPEPEEEDAAVVLRRQEVPDTADEIVRLYLSRNEDLVRLQGCRQRPTGCTPGVQQAMLIRLEQAKELMVRMANSAIDVTDPQHRDVVVHMRSRARREFKISSDWLSAPSAMGDPDACWYLGRVWGEGLSGTRDPDIAAKLFRCAAIGYRVRGDLAAAVQSFQRLTKLVDPRHPMAAEVYARVWADDSRSAKGRSHGSSGDHH